MSAVYKAVRRYAGPVRGLVMDFSGTTVDKYVIAPAVVFQEVFKKYGIDITMSEARGPPGTMGLGKDLHISILLQQPDIKSKWEAKYGRPSTDNDVQEIYRDFIPMQLAVLRRYGTLLPNTKEILEGLRKEKNIKVGVSTGFNRAMADILIEEAKKQGFVFDATAAGDDCINGARPKPNMLYKNLDIMDVSPIQSVVKIDDSSAGIGEGLSAGCWTVGIARWSTYMDINDLADEAKLSPHQLQEKLQRSRGILGKAGAHYVINEITELPSVINDINARMKNGETPMDLHKVNDRKDL